jgi:hypothetical protein
VGNGGEAQDGVASDRWPGDRNCRSTGWDTSRRWLVQGGVWLRKVVLGYYQYHAVPGNTTQLRIFKLRVCRLWQSVLVRRSQRAQMRWERLTPVLNRWIPPPRVLHPYPDVRFYATHPS